jgi:hypothetical protein
VPADQAAGATPAGAAVEPLLEGGRVDYADAFEVRTPQSDGRTAEEWARCGLEEAPQALQLLVYGAQRYVLRLRLAPLASADHVFGWRILTSRPEVVGLEARSPVLRGLIVGRRVDATCVTLTTYVAYERPVARVLWAVVAPLHRMVAPYLLARAAVPARRTCTS